MADYKRVIAYIYNYENGIKRNSVGYARIELRGMRCRVTVYVKTPSIKGGLKTCFFFRKDNAVHCVQLGEMEVKDGVGEFHVEEPANDLMGTAYAFEEMSGLLLYESKEKFFGSEWDDRPIELDEMRFVDKKDRKGSETELIQEDKQEERQAEKRVEEKVAERVEATQPATEEKAVMAAGLPEEAEAHSQTVAGELTKGMDDAYSRKLQAAELVENKAEVQQNAPRDDKRGNRGAISGRYIKKDAKDVEFAEYLLEEYPKMYPFEDDEISGCVRIEPQDIGMFPMESWSLANNSFLLQGYYGYRHLIFVRTKRGNNVSYLLGVPGIFHNREEFMARMFGFHLFKSVKRKENKRGEFGYWFIHIKVPRR